MLLVKLIGRPGAWTDGAATPSPRGNKAWALLAYLVTAGAPVPRERLVRMLFADAQDGLAALRWNLAQVRRMLGGGAVSGDPVALGLPPNVRIDLQELGTAPWYALTDDVELGPPLLEGMSFPSCAGLELWLEGERQRVRGLVAAVLREEARAHAAAGEHRVAARAARRLIALEPWEEGAHELLVRALAQGGDVAAAHAHVTLVTGLFLDEFGTPPSRALEAAADPVMAYPSGATRTRTLAQLRAGAAAVAAGAPDSGIESLHRAVAGARALGDPELLVRTLTEVGSAHVHAVRGSDEAGVAALGEAVAVAERAGRPALATAACRELAYVEFLRCRSRTADLWLDRASETAGADDPERAWILFIRGSLRSDAGRHGEARLLLEEAVAAAGFSGNRHAAAMALTHLGRLHVLRQEHGAAEQQLQRAQALAEELGWLSFAPYPAAWLAEVALRREQVADAGDLFAHAYGLALEVGDPCWESLACRGMGLVAAATGDQVKADRLLHEAPRACRRLSDTYLWIEAYGLSAQASHAVASGSPRALVLIEDLDRLAAANGLRELQAEAALLRVQAGITDAVEAARTHIAAVDNPVLAARLAELEARAPV